MQLTWGKCCQAKKTQRERNLKRLCAQIALSCFPGKGVLVFFSVAGNAECQTIRYFIAEVWIVGKPLDMMGMQIVSLPVATAGAAFLAGVVVSFKYGLAPLFVFALVSCGAVGVCFSGIVRPLLGVGLDRCCVSNVSGDGFRKTRSRTKLPFSGAAYEIARHWFSAIRAWFCFCGAIWAYAVTTLWVGVVVNKNLLAHAARSTEYRAGHSEPNGTRLAGWDFPGEIVVSNGRNRSATFRAWLGALGNAVFAHTATATTATYSAVHQTHTLYCIPLFDCVNVQFLNFSDATGGTPELVE